MNWPDVSRDSLAERFPLSRVTTFRIGGPARWAVSPRDGNEVAAALRTARDAGMAVHVVGMGSNLLVADGGVDGLVLLARTLSSRGVDGDLAVFGSGVSNAVALRFARAHGLGGLECLVGYPGTLGGAVRMNAGGTSGYIGDRVEWVRAVDRDGAVRVLSPGECAFRYRGSDLDHLVVTEVALRLPLADPEEFLLRCREIYDRKRSSQPLHLPSAGCVWKNPSRVSGGGRSAGRLVDEAGCKGLRVGGAEVSSMHANFMVNLGGATCADVLALCDEVHRRVLDATGVHLEREVILWGGVASTASVA